jgi:hypothetical protein
MQLDHSLVGEISAHLGLSSHTSQELSKCCRKVCHRNHLNILTSYSSFDFILIGNLYGQLAS